RRVDALAVVEIELGDEGGVEAEAVSLHRHLANVLPGRGHSSLVGDVAQKPAVDGGPVSEVDAHGAPVFLRVGGSQMRASARSRSAMISAGSSSPALRRMVFNEMPAAARCAAFRCECVMD